MLIAATPQTLEGSSTEKREPATQLQKDFLSSERGGWWEGFPSEITKDLSSVPPLHGYVLTSNKEDAEPVLQVINEGEQGADVDPILSTWQYGLGKSAAFTSDLSLKWGKDCCWRQAA